VAKATETLATASALPPAPPRTQKAVVPFDFISKFDNGRYGQIVGDMIYKRLEREGVFLIPASMADVRDLCLANGLSIGPDTPLEKVKEAVQKTFNSDIGIWGSMERVPGNQWDVYDFTIKCVDFSAAEPKVIYEKTNVRTKVVSEVPHLYVQEMFDKLYQREPEQGPVVNQMAEENWAKNPNLVQGGDFQKGSGGAPDGWEKGGGQDREPLGRLVRWVSEEGNPGNKLIRLSFDEEVGNSYGVMYYSLPFPVEEGATYRFQCRYRTNGPEVKVFIKCYDRMTSQYKAPSPSDAQLQPASAAAGPSEYVPGLGQLREVYRSQQNLTGPKNTWNTQTQDFTPKHPKYVPRWGRVMLYGYKGAGVVDFDDVVVKQVIPASPSASKKILRHSSQSSVTLEEMHAAEKQPEEKPESGAVRKRGSRP
jgi:hypothetical protein